MKGVIECADFVTCYREMIQKHHYIRKNFEYADDEIPGEMKRVIECADFVTYCFEIIQKHHNIRKIQYNTI